MSAGGNVRDALSNERDAAGNEREPSTNVPPLARTFYRRRMLRVSRLGFSFHERMKGTARRPGEERPRAFDFDLDVRAPSLLGFVTTAIGLAHGTLRLEGLATDVPAHGHMEISPLHRHVIRYVLEFQADDGRTYRFDGQKDTSTHRRLLGWTTLPGQILDDHGQVWGDALLRFSLRRELAKLLWSFKVGRRVATTA